MAESLLYAKPAGLDEDLPYDGAAFIDRRREKAEAAVARERRQFTNSHDGLSDDAAELARAIDSYKARCRRRFINYEEMLSVVKSLGYGR